MYIVQGAVQLFNSKRTVKVIKVMILNSSMNTKPSNVLPIRKFYWYRLNKTYILPRLRRRFGSEI